MYPSSHVRNGCYFFRTRVPVLLLFVSLLYAAPVSAEPRPLRVLFTHDLHSYLSPHSVRAADGRVVEAGGYARLAGAVSEARLAAGGACLVVDAGDFAEGTLYHTVFSSEAPELRTMGAIGYDAATFGNHDFDFSPSGLAGSLDTAKLKGARLPALVISNLRFSSGDPADAGLKRAFLDFPVREYTVLERGGVRIGIFGLLGRDAAEDSPYSKPVAFGDAAENAGRVVRLLREKERVDLVVCLSHGGTNPIRSRSEDENLAAKVPGIDLIISGHTHTLLAQPKVVGNTVIVSAGPYGERLGILDLKVGRGAPVSIAGYRLQKIDDGIREDREVTRQVAAFTQIVEQRYLSHFGYAFSQVLAVMPFDGASLDSLYAHPGENGLGNLVTDAYRYAVRRAEGPNHRRVDAAIDVLGCIRSPLLRGRITVAEAFQTASLGPVQHGWCGNTIVAPYMTGADLKNLLEVETSLAPSKKDGHLSVSGIRFSYNPNRMFLDRVTSVELQGDDGVFVPIRMDGLYRVAVNSYVANLVDLISTKSHGLLKVVFRDATGAVSADPDRFTVMDGREALREWVALARYLSSFPAMDGIPVVPERYRAPEGRIVVAASWNPVALVSGGNWLTWSAVALAVATLFLAALSVSAAMRRMQEGNKSRNKS